jgi:hypothetical protein
MGTSSSVSSTFTALRRFIKAALIIDAVASGLTLVLCLPAILLGKSKILVYALLFSSVLASTFSLLAALLSTALSTIIISVVGSIGPGLGLFVTKGNKALVFLWLNWVLVSLATGYWLAVWFIEVRSWSWVRRTRAEKEKENWKSAGRGIKEDLRGNRGVNISREEERKETTNTA